LSLFRSTAATISHWRFRATGAVYTGYPV
jgi:hypothetical protein